MGTAGVAFLLSMVVAALLTSLIAAWRCGEDGSMLRSAPGRFTGGRSRLGGITIVGSFHAPLAALLLYQPGRDHPRGRASGSLVSCAIGNAPSRSGPHRPP